MRNHDDSTPPDRCVQPEAPWVSCAVCGVKVKTCERAIPVDFSYRCPSHPNGYERRNGWVCSDECGELAEEREWN